VTPFLKWVGGKRRIRAKVLEAIGRVPDGATYYEPYLGGGAVLLGLLEAQPGTEAIAGDINSRLVDTWWAVQRHPSLLQEAVAEMFSDITEARYYEVRDAFNDAETDIVRTGARMIYLNKTGFNGLYRENKSGRMNVAWGKRVSVEPPLEQIQLVSRLLETVGIRKGPATHVVRDVDVVDIVYMDPPYVPLSKGSDFVGYTAGGFDHRQGASLASWCADRCARVCVSNSDTPATRALYASFEFERVQARRSVGKTAASRKRVGEVIATKTRKAPDQPSRPGA
jgi:DNA adenine methylase